MIQSKPSIFISYGRGDDHDNYNDPEKSFLRRLYNDLTDTGYAVWWDRESMPARGLTFLQEIQDAVTAHDKFILVVGEHAINSEYVRAELQFAQQICKPIIPLLIKGDYSLIPTSIANYHAPDFRKSRSYDLAIAELLRILDEPQPEPARTYNLPALPRGYIERDEFAKVKNVVLEDTLTPTVTRDEDRVIFIQGSGGIGKTIIASALGRLCEVRRRYHDAVIWKTVGKNPQITQLQGDIGVIFGDSRDNYQDIQSGKTRLRSILENKRVLIILDDVWNHKDIEPFMALGPRCRLLVTTREYSISLKIEGREHDIAKLTEEEGLNLLGTWQKREPNAKNPHKDEELQIIDYLDGYTLAVAMAGAKLANKRSGYTHAQLLSRLREGRTFQDLQLDDEDKNFNLEKSLFLSYVDLSEDDQRRFRYLGVLAPNSSASLQLVSALWEDDETTAQDALNRFVDSALLYRSDDNQWIQHSILRAYALALLKAEEDEVFCRYVKFITTISNFLELSQHRWDAVLGQYYLHIDYMGNKLLSSYVSDPEQFGELFGNFIWQVENYILYRPVTYSTPNGFQRKGLDWLLAAEKIFSETGQLNKQPSTLNNIGFIYSELGDKQLALNYYEKAIPIYDEIDNNEGKAVAMGNVAAIYSALGDIDKALKLYQDVLPIFRELNQSRLIVTTLNNIGMIFDKLGDQDQALDYYQQVLDMGKDDANQGYIAGTLNNIGGIHSARGEYYKALDYFRQALSRFRWAGDRASEATILNNIAEIMRQNDQADEAIKIYHQILDIANEIGSFDLRVTTSGNLALAYQQLNELQQAISYAELSVNLLRSRNRVFDPSGIPIEKYESFLTQLREDAEFQEFIDELTALYESHGRDVVITILKKNNAPEDLISQTVAEIEKRLQEKSMEVLKDILEADGENIVRKGLSAQGLDDHAIDEIIEELNAMPPTTPEEPTETKLQQLTRYFIQHGEQYVRNVLATNPPEAVESAIAEIKQNLHQESMKALKKVLDTEGESKVYEILKSQGVSEEATNKIIGDLKGGD